MHTAHLLAKCMCFKRTSLNRSQGGLMSRGQAHHVIYPMTHVMYLPPPLNRMTDTCKNTTFQQLRWRVVKV